MHRFVKMTIPSAWPTWNTPNSESAPVWYLTFTGKAHVHVESGPGDNRRAGPVIRGIPCYGSAHLYLWSDGGFHFTPEGGVAYTTASVYRSDKGGLDAPNGCVNRFHEILRADIEDSFSERLIGVAMGLADALRFLAEVEGHESNILRLRKELMEEEAALAGAKAGLKSANKSLPDDMKITGNEIDAHFYFDPDKVKEG